MVKTESLAELMSYPLTSNWTRSSNIQPVITHKPIDSFDMFDLKPTCQPIYWFQVKHIKWVSGLLRVEYCRPQFSWRFKGEKTLTRLKFKAFTIWIKVKWSIKLILWQVGFRLNMSHGFMDCGLLQVEYCQP